MPKWKRIFDVAGSLFFLIIFSPVMGLIIFYIKVVSPGPVLYKSQRVGFRGENFTFLKFRTMNHNNGKCLEHRGHQQYCTELIQNGDLPMEKLDGNDKRIYPGGSILRTLSLDELPQLINILKGEMSLVGPRPCIPYEKEQYLKIFKDEITRFDVMPGLTGLWQVSGKNRLTFKQMLELDARYAKNLYFWMDLLIVLRTIPTVIDLGLDPLRKSIRERRSRSMQPKREPAKAVLKI